MIVDYSSDAPLTDAKDDRFGRAPFATRIAETLANREDSDSLVVALYGMWGGGKSTVLNFVRNDLGTHKNVLVETFNPWLFSSTEGLLQEFFGTVAGILEEKLRTPRQNLGRILSGTGAAVGGASLAFGGLGVVPGRAVSALGGWLSASDVEDMRDHVGKILIKSKKRVVILIDDIDRLDIEETYLLFRLIKLVADFPNTSYLLAFDDKVVAAALKRRYPEQTDVGANFLEKIVQVPLSLPPAPTATLRDIATEGVDRTLAQAELVLSDEEVHRFTKTFDIYIVPELRTPRVVQRLLNGVQFALPMTKGEVDAVDLLLIEAVRATAPSLHDWIAKNQTLLTEPEFYLIGHSGPSDEHRAVLDQVFAEMSPISKVRYKAVLMALFPKTKQMLEQSVFAGSASWESFDEKAWSRERRIASSDYFHRYFLYAVPPDDIPDVVIRELIEFADNDDPGLGVALEALIEANARGLIEKLSNLQQDLNDSARRSLAISLSRVSGGLSHDDGGVLSLSTADRAAALVSNLVAGIGAQDERDSLGALSVEAAPLGFAGLLFGWLGRGADEGRILSESAVSSVREALGERIIEAEQVESLISAEPQMAGRLYLIASGSSAQESLQAVLGERASNFDFATDLVRAFLPTTQSLETGLKARAPLEARGLESLERVVDRSVLDAIFASRVDAPEGDDTESRYLDSSDSEAVARSFLSVARDVDASRAALAGTEDGSG